MAKSTITDDPVSEHDKFMLRLPRGMRDRIKAAADQNGRSMNGEIVATLEEKYPLRVSLDDFFDQWVNHLKELDRKEQEQLIEEANRFLQAHVREDFFVWLESPKDDGPYAVVFGNIPGPLIRPSTEVEET